MTYGAIFCNKFKEAYLECRALFDANSWSQVWYTYWNNFMLWNPIAPQSKPVLEVVAEKMNLKWWDREPFRLDGVFVHKDYKLVGNYPLPIIVGIEHENDLRTFGQEIAKLAYIRCPLKVGITYTLAIPGPVPQEIILRSQGLIKKAVSDILSDLSKWIGEDPQAEYVYLLGVESQVLELDWYALCFLASTDPSVSGWTAI